MRLERGLLHGLAAGLLTLAVAPSQASAWCQMTSYSGRRLPEEEGLCILVANHPGESVLAWQRRCTSISLSSVQASSTLSMDEVRGVFQRSIASWTSVDCGGALTGLSVDVLTDTNLCASATHNREGRNVHSVMFIQEGWVTERRLSPIAFAVTYVWHNAETGEIYDGDMLLNDSVSGSRGPFAICTEDACPRDAGGPFAVDLENIVTHEMGHYFGIAHTEDIHIDATMFQSAPPGERSKRSLEEDDETALCAIYPPGTLPEACDNTPRGGLALDCQAHNCGCATPGLPSASGPLGVGSLAGLLVMVWARRKRSAG